MSNRIRLMEEMNRIRHDILAMSVRVEEDLMKALEALKSGNVDLAREVKAGDAVVNALQLKIEDQAAILIATQQPVARDLRELVTLFKVTDNLERAGDHAVHLAKAAIKLSGWTSEVQVERLERMALAGRDMIRGAVAAYLDQDVVSAQRVAKMDDAIDSEHRILVEEVLGLMMGNPQLVKAATKIIQTSGYLERLGDHMTNICEAVIYMVEGRREELNE
ncbi:MAG: phosphate signaling complex protein PhoU [Rectinemataceae bacterium]|nr:phosphate signaling complex protein PhoU [Rectinemataceae bacterium]